MEILKSKSGYSFNTDTNERINPDGSVITLDSVQSNPTPYKLPETTPDTSATNLNNNISSFNQSQQDAFTTELENIKQKYGNTTDITNLMKSISDVEAGQTKIAEDLGSTENLKAYKKFNTDIQLLDENTRQAIEKIQRENPTGALRGGQADLIKNLERDTANKKAILTIQRSAALGDYQTAIDTAKAQVEMQLAPLKAELDRLKYVRDENKDFQTAEMNLAIKKKENELKKEQDTLDRIANLKVSVSQNGAPISVLQKLSEAKTFDEALQIATKYTTDPLDRAIKQEQLNKLKKESGTSEKINKISDSASNVVDVAISLLNNPDLGSITGTIQQYTGGLVGAKAKLAKNQFNQLMGMLKLENRQQLKGSGAISDFEFKVLGEASSVLGRNLSDEDFKNELQKLVTKLSPEYQYIEGISNIIDNTGQEIDTSDYINNLLGK